MRYSERAGKASTSNRIEPGPAFMQTPQTGSPGLAQHYNRTLKRGVAENAPLSGTFSMMRQKNETKLAR